jgi:hypothetical protein
MIPCCAKKDLNLDPRLEVLDTTAFPVGSPAGSCRVTFAFDAGSRYCESVQYCTSSVTIAGDDNLVFPSS